MKKLLLGCLLLLTFFTWVVPSEAAMRIIRENEVCRTDQGLPVTVNGRPDAEVALCAPSLVCLANTNPTFPGRFTCQKGNSILEIFGQVVPPQSIINIGFGSAGVSNIVNTAIRLIFTVASILFIFMLLISALQWIMSGGDKEAIGKARGRLIYAIVGIVVLALAFVIARIVEGITGIPFF